MTVEERVRRALAEQADAVDVDLTRLHDATLAATLGRVRTPRRAAPVLVIATVVAVVAAAMLGTTWLVQGARTRAPADAGPVRGVAASFTCPSRDTVGDAGRRRDDSFVPSLTGGPAAAAAALGAPRYDFVENGRTATLRLGNADRSLASISVFRRTSDGWDLVTTTKCVAPDGGVLVPDEAAGRLGRHGSTPYPPGQMVDDAARAVLVDDRESYDAAGLVRHRSMWVAPWGAADVCVASGSPTKMSMAIIRADTLPSDITSLFLDRDYSEGRPNPWGMWIVADPGRTVLGVHAATWDGRSVAAVRRRGPDWTGQVYVLLAESAAVDTISVRTAEGTRAYPKGAIRPGSVT